MEGSRPASAPLKVVLFWHMHQPQYRDCQSGEYHQPWVYLHVLKDYVDMAAHLEAHPKAHAVVNFAPVLLEQIDDYAAMLRDWFDHGARLRDPLLRGLFEVPPVSDVEGRRWLLSACLRANQHRLIDRFPAFSELAAVARNALETPVALRYLDDRFFFDLCVWYHLAWTGETVRMKDARIKSLMSREREYAEDDRRLLLEVMLELHEGLVGRYRALAESGRVELAMSPWGHPIVPLMLDLESAREALPEIELPQLPHYPGGEEAARWHIEQGIASFERSFGFKPTGCWPSEGAVSEATARLLGEYPFTWLASGETVLRNSLAASEVDAGGCLHRPWTAPDSDILCFFRDDGLSDLIGFTYSNWHAEDAVGNMIHHLENIAQACTDQPGRVVSIILDGENAWEYYPNNGWYFLNTLYKRLSEHPTIELTTFSKAARSNPGPGHLTRMVGGSWVYGTYSTWIGDPDKNRGWDYLGDAKTAFDRVAASERLDEEALEKARLQLAICEGSDWFWWFGDYNPAESVSDFERLYRSHLSCLYQLLGEPAPSYLTEAISHGGGDVVETGGVMRRGKQG